MPRRRLKTDGKTLKRAFYDIHGRLEDSDTPAASYLEKLLNQIEDDEYTAESLKDVISKIDDDDVDIVPKVSPDGTLKMKAIRSSGKLPTSTE